MDRNIDHVAMTNTEPSTVGPLLCVVGARPNFMKMAPLLRAFAATTPGCRRGARAYRPALRRRA